MIRNLEMLRKSVNDYNSYGLDKKRNNNAKEGKKVTSQSVI